MNMNESAKKNRDKQKEREREEETLRDKYVRQARVLFFMNVSNLAPTFQ